MLRPGTTQAGLINFEKFQGATMTTFHGRSLAACIAVAGSLFLRAPSQAAEPLELSYISSDAVAALVLQPRRVLTAPEMEMLPIEVIVAAGQQYLGIDPTEVEQAIGILGLAGLANGEPGFGAILRFAKPYDQMAVLARLGAQTRESTHAGKKYWQAHRRAVSACSCRMTARFSLAPTRC